MGAVVTWLYDHGRLILGWMSLLAAGAALIYAVFNSELFDYVTDWTDKLGRYLETVATSPAKVVTAVRGAYDFAYAENTPSHFLLWLCGIDLFAECLAVFGGAYTLGGQVLFHMLTASGTIFVAIRAYRAVARFANVITKGATDHAGTLE